MKTNLHNEKLEKRFDLLSKTQLSSAHDLLKSRGIVQFSLKNRIFIFMIIIHSRPAKDILPFVVLSSFEVHRPHNKNVLLITVKQAGISSLTDVQRKNNFGKQKLELSSFILVPV